MKILATSAYRIVLVERFRLFASPAPGCGSGRLLRCSRSSATQTKTGAERISCSIPDGAARLLEKQSHGDHDSAGSVYFRPLDETVRFGKPVFRLREGKR